MEIEIKAKCTNYPIVENNLRKLNATIKKESRQVDEYYNAPTRDIRKTNEYLRLRYNFSENKGTFAYHINIADGVNDETEVDISDIEKLRKILVAFGFELLGKIDKHRKKFLLNEFVNVISNVLYPCFAKTSACCLFSTCLISIFSFFDVLLRRYFPAPYTRNAIPIIMNNTNFPGILLFAK